MDSHGSDPLHAIILLLANIDERQSLRGRGRVWHGQNQGGMVRYSEQFLDRDSGQQSHVFGCRFKNPTRRKSVAGNGWNELLYLQSESEHNHGDRISTEPE